MICDSLRRQAARCRLRILQMLRASGRGHIGGAYSAMDIITALYFYKMQLDPGDPQNPDRDRFILSAGHKCLAQYAALVERGYFPPDLLDTFGHLDSRLPGHPDMHKLPGVEANTGALGHGLSIAVGMALGLRLDRRSARVYVVIGDGELAEGSNWEAMAAAAHHKVDNLVMFLDNNGLQISGDVREIMDFSPYAQRIAAFGWAVQEIDGNNMEEIVDALDHLPLEPGKPTAIIAHTVKSKGLSFGEGRVEYHYWKPTDTELDQAEAECRSVLARYGGERV